MSCSPFPLSSDCFRPGFVVAVLIVLGWANAMPAEDVIPHFTQRLWRRTEGLPSNKINALTIDHAGFLWIATTNGPARFDGHRFLKHDVMPNGQLAAGDFGAIAADPAGEDVWAAPRAGGLFRLRAGRFEECPLPPGYERQRAARLLVAGDGALWIAFEGGAVMRLHGNRHEVFGAASGFGPQRASQLATDGSGRVWLANQTRLAWYEAGALHTFPLEGLKENVRIASSRGNGPWVLTRGWLHRVVDGQLAAKIKLNASFNADSVQTLLEDTRDAVWIGTRARGVYRMTPSNEGSDLIIAAPEDIGSLVEDPAGNIWAGANGGGLVRIRAATLRHFDKTMGLLDSHALGVCEDRAGVLWIANREGGAAYINEQGRIHTLAPPSGRATFTVRSVVPAPEGGVFIATSYGILRATTEGWLAGEVAGAMPPTPEHGQIRVTHLARNGDLWVVLAPARMGRLREGVWHVFTESDGLPPREQLQSLAEDSQGRVWVGTEESRLYSFDGTRFTPVTFVAPADAGSFQALYFDENGTGWIGTSGAGLLRLDAPAGRHLTDRHGLPTRNVTQVISDDHGNLWLGSLEGVFHMRREEVERFFAGDISRVEVVSLGMDDGLDEATCANAHQPSVWKGRDGLLWFATREGVVAIDPRREKREDTPLVVKIDAVRTAEASWSATGPVRVPALSRTLELDYSVPNLSTPDRVRTRVRLEGYDDEWTIPEAKGLARYARLPPGKYRFVVEAHLAGQPGTSARTSLPVIVEAAWWQTLWFRAGGVTLVLLLGGLTVRTWSHRRLRRRLEQLEQSSVLERERARIAQNIHDDLGSGLTRISLLTQSAAVNDGRAQLDKIYSTVSELTQSMDEIVWAVNPKHDDLEGLANYLVEFAQGFLQDAGIRCRVLLPEFLPTATLTTQSRHHLFMGCKEALNNIAKHAQASEVSLQLSVMGEGLMIVIADNGHGFVVSAVTPGSARAGTGNGLTNMRTRLATLGGTCEISSSPAGTIVMFTAPLAVTPSTPP